MNPLQLVIIDGVEHSAEIFDSTNEVIVFKNPLDGSKLTVNRNKYHCPVVGTYIYKTEINNISLKIVLQQEKVASQHHIDQSYLDILTMINGKLTPAERSQFQLLIDAVEQAAYQSGLYEDNLIDTLG